MSGFGLGAQISLVLLLFAFCVMILMGLRRTYTMRMAIRFLRSHFQMNLALLCAACVSTTVISGSLIAGDSLRESLKEAVYENLGEVDEIATSNSLFNSSIALRLSGEAELSDYVDHITSILYINGIAVNPQTEARTQKARIIGIHEGFFDFGNLYNENGVRLTYGLNENEIYVNDKIARELGLKKGDMLRISFSEQDAIIEAIFHSDSQRRTFDAMFQIAEIVRSESLGRFQLTSNRNSPMNVYVPIDSLNTVMGLEDSSNMILVSNVGDEREGGRLCNEVADLLENALDSTLTMEDVGFSLVENQKLGYVKLESDDIFFSYDYFELLKASEIPAMESASPALTYFWNTLTFSGNTVAYSAVTAFDPDLDGPFGHFVRNGTEELIEGDLEDDEIIINNWTALALSAGIGDQVLMNYSIMDDFYNIRYHHRNFAIREIIDLDGKADDAMLMPSFPGIQGMVSPLDWDPPFPIDFTLIEDDDEDYWKTYEGTPKAFVSLIAGGKLWNTDIGNITLVKMKPKSGYNLSDLSIQIEDVLNENIGIREMRITIKTVKVDALKAEEGTEIFSQMFLAFSFACIIASSVLVVLLITLRIDHRMREIGILRSLGFKIGAINNIYLLEGAMVSILGGFLGVVIGILFGAFLIGGMNTFWSQIVEGANVSLSYTPDSVIIGLSLGILISLITMTLALRYEGRNTIVGSIRRISKRPREKGKIIYPLVPLILGIALLISPILFRPSFESEVGLILLVMGFPLFLFAFNGMAARRSGKQYFHFIGILLVIFTLYLIFSFSQTVSLAILFFLSGFLLLFGFISIFYQRILFLENKDKPSLKEKVWLFDLAKKNAARTPKRTMFSVFLFALTLFVLVSLTINIQGVVFDIDRAISENGGGYQIMGESVGPIYADLGDEGSRKGIGIQDDVFDDLSVEQFMTRGDVGGTCSNLNPHASPKIIGANETFFTSNSFVFTSYKGNEMNNPWLLLTEDRKPNEVPCIGDYNTIIWILGLDIGSTISVMAESGEVINMRIIGIIGNSIFPGSLIIWDDYFREVYPTDDGFDLFLFKSEEEDLNYQIISLESALSPYGFDAFTVKSVVVENMQVENTYISIFQVILVFGLIIGTVGFGLVASRNAYERRREIGILRALGFSRSKVVRVLVFENTYIISAGIVIGLLSGIIASGVYLLKLDIDIGSWPWLYVLALVLISLVIALTSTVIPVIRSSKMVVTEAIRAEE